MKKSILVVTFALCILLGYSQERRVGINQTVKTQLFKVDTVPGHGYEVMLIGIPITRKLFVKTNSGIKDEMHGFFQQGDYSWKEALIKYDSLKYVWNLPTPSQLRTVFKFSQATLDKNNIKIGSVDYQGINGLFWCYNGELGSKLIVKSVYIGGATDSRNYGFDIGYEAANDYSTDVAVLKCRANLLFIKPY